MQQKQPCTCSCGCTETAKRTIFICQGTGCESGKSVQIREAIEKQVATLGLTDVKVDFTGCHGFCQKGPIAVVEPEGIFYSHVKVEDVPDIVNSHLKNGKPVKRLFYTDPITGRTVPNYKDITFYREQTRIILRNCGHINPERIEDYMATGGYEALKKAVTQMTPEQVIAEMKASGLRGRGGAGFPTATKWEFCRRSPGDIKYIICNADEGDPGAFMDRSAMEADPHTVIEGLAIAGYAIGATEGYFYIRAEYPLAIKRLRIALKHAEERGFLGKNIFGSKFSLKVHVMEGAGAFVCGEETALIASIEGNRGMPNPRPPFPAVSGLFGKPTNINNVKTLATVPVIIGHGAEWYCKIGTEKSKGTAVFALTGKIANSGLVEVPMGTTLEKIVFEIGGGIPNGKRFKAVQTGGPSGGCLPAALLKSPVDYETLAKAGSIMGSGGMVVVDEDNCMVDLARYFLSFTQSESCGKCVPCRIGTKEMLNLLTNISNGKGREEDIDILLELAETIRDSALCGLGQTAPNPVLTTIKYFRDEYEEHIRRGHCRAAVCKGLVSAPCSHTCPAGVDVPRYVRFIGAGKPDEALATIRENIPFPSVCGYVCFHPCESKCRRALLDEAVDIRMLKRFAADSGNGLWRDKSKVAPPTGKKVAVVGGGPAGLTAAYYLAKLGHSVTLFESLPKAGGMMRYGIPDYRLPKALLDKEIDEIKNVGVTIKTNTRMEFPQKLMDEGYNAVYMAIGAWQPMKMGVPGEDNAKVKDCVSFLRDAAMGKGIKLTGQKVAVIGGGNVAIDSARSALRLGSDDVTIVYRRTRDQMPASLEEIEAAVEEGVKIEYLAAPNKVTSHNGQVALECIKMRLGDIEPNGRRRVEPIPGSEFTLTYDTIIAAIGQRPEVAPQAGLAIGKGNTIQADAYTLATDKTGIFTGGDAFRGPASVIEAIADGRQAAVSIDKFLGGNGVITEKLAPSEGDVPPMAEAEEGRRPKVHHIPVSERKSFDLVEGGLSRRLAIKEAGRCLRCDLEKNEEE
jgi:NADH-quinone oxidoreductase subunit F